jgi:hypothetical protein
MEPTIVDGKLMFLRFSDGPDASAADVLKIVCLMDSNYNGTRNEITDETNCGALSNTGPAKHQFTGTGVIDTVPDTDEASYKEIQDLFLADTEKYWELSDEDQTIYHAGYGKITQLGNQNTASGGGSKFTLTVSITGTLVNTPQS